MSQQEANGGYGAGLSCAFESTEVVAGVGVGVSAVLKEIRDEGRPVLAGSQAGNLVKGRENSM